MLIDSNEFSLYSLQQEIEDRLGTNNDFGFSLIISLKICFPIDPPVPVIQIFKLSIDALSNFWLGSTATLPSKSSISMGRREFIVRFPVVKSLIDGTFNTGISFF